MALDPRERAKREFALSGRAGLADLPALLRQAAQQQANPNVFLLGGAGEGASRQRGSPGINPLINIFGGSAAPGSATPGAATAGGGGSALPGFTGPSPSSTGRFGGDTGAGDAFSDPSVTMSDFGPFSTPRNIMNLMGFLSGSPFLGTTIGKMFQDLFGPYGVIGPERPIVGTDLFAKMVAAGRQADVANQIQSEPFLSSPMDPFSGPGGEPGGFGPVGLSEADELNEFGGGGGGMGGGDDMSGVGTGPGEDMGGGMVHGGGLISEAERPGTAQDVNKTLQEGEFVVRREAVQALGPAFLRRLNRAGTKRLSSVMVPPRQPGGRR